MKVKAIDYWTPFLLKRERDRQREVVRAFLHHHCEDEAFAVLRLEPLVESWQPEVR